MTLELLGRKDSVNVQKVMWFMDELGLDYSHQELGGSFGGLDEPEFLAMNPAGLVPVLKDGDFALSESNAILRYLAMTQPGGEAFYPADPKLRGKIDAWMDFGSQSLFPDFVTLFIQIVKTLPKDRRANVVGITNRRFQAKTLNIGQALGESPWIMGQDFTLADIATGVYMYRYYSMPALKRVTQGRVEVWVKRLQERQAYTDTVCTAYRHMFAA